MFYQPLNKTCKLSFIIIIAIFLWLPKANGEENNNVCLNGNLEASFELKDNWIYVCQENKQKIFRQFSKNNQQEIITIPASGNFPTYAAIEGDLYNPNSKIYNISPYDFKIIQASIIQTIQPVINAIHQPTGVNVTILSGEKEQQAIAICGQKKPVQVFETVTDNIYICISAPDNNDNAIDLSYIQQSKTNPEKLINLPAELASSFSYQANNQNQSYLISYQGLDIYKNQTKISTQPVINLYLVTSDENHEDTH